MALVHYAIWAHGGAADEQSKKVFALPGDHIYVAFYVPPGRSSGTNYSKAVFEAIKAGHHRLATLDKVEAWHRDVRGAIRSRPIQGNTPASAMNLYTDLDFKEWPRLVGKGYAGADHLLDYALLGSKDVAELGIYRCGSNQATLFSQPDQHHSLKQVVMDIAGNHPDAAKETVVIHVISCREERADANPMASLFAEPDADSRQQIALQKGIDLPGIPV